MGWEKRQGGRYYYRKRRIDGRVVSEYIGHGQFAEALAALDELRRSKRLAEQEAWRREREADLAIAREIDEIGDAVRVLTRAALLTAGFHTHSGQWRRRRGR